MKFWHTSRSPALQSSRNADLELRNEIAHLQTQIQDAKHGRLYRLLLLILWTVAVALAAFLTGQASARPAPLPRSAGSLYAEPAELSLAEADSRQIIHDPKHAKAPVHIGPHGGKYHISPKSGKKVYEHRNR